MCVQRELMNLMSKVTFPIVTLYVFIIMFSSYSEWTLVKIKPCLLNMSGGLQKFAICITVCRISLNLGVL